MKFSCLLILMALSYFFNPIEPIVSKKPAVDLTYYDQSVDIVQEELDASLLDDDQWLYIS